MKKIFYFLAIFSTIFFYNCETNEKFTGSPVGNQEIITLDAIISSNVEFATSGQDVEFNFVLPRTFKDTATVEVTAVNSEGGRTRKKVDIMPGQVSPLPSEVVKITSPGSGDMFFSQFEMSITAISLKHAEIGKHYLIKSNVLSIETGKAGSITATNAARLSVELVWPSYSGTNDVALKIQKPSGTVVEPTSQQSGGKLHSIRVSNTPILSDSDINNSNAEGEYVFSMTGRNLAISPQNMPYIVIVVFPNGDRKFYTGTYENLYVDAPLKNLIKVTKNPVGATEPFTVSEL
ncbi:MAG: hypothetical protein O9267_10880 [Flavobacterium sp.]|uniref:hypothetical protein n=1 Tax=Flavobacterium sp. TaxID=239 RepID=UPI0022C3A6BD|nr:hypothetical protein [Flavobacterium sp.]MCZ8198102.1 hypothetical protein [Flavobacterium sp.]